MFPLLYPEVFERFKIAPPRGVLFHGPPGAYQFACLSARVSTANFTRPVVLTTSNVNDCAHVGSAYLTLIIQLSPEIYWVNENRPTHGPNRYVRDEPKIPNRRILCYLNDSKSHMYLEDTNRLYVAC